MAKTLTVAIPTYERASFLVETLETLLPQLEKRVDIVVSDNGSQDGTGEILQKYQRLCPKLKICGFPSNRGIDHNIVNCLKKAQGDYVFFFSDDDLLMPGSLQKVLAAIDGNKPTMLCLNHFCFKNHNLAERYKPFLPCKNKIFTEGAAFFKYCGLGFLSSLIVDRRKALQEAAFGYECAHLDIGARVALKYPGPFIFLGEVSVAGRSLLTPRYDALKSCILFPKKFYETLFEEGLLSKEELQFFLSKLLHKDLPRVIAKMHLYSSVDPKSYKPLLDEAFASHKRYRYFYAHLFFVNKRWHKRLLWLFMQGKHFLRKALL